MVDLVALEKRVARIEDRQAAIDVVFHYAQCIREGRPDAAARCFRDDGRFELRIPNEKGYDIGFKLEGMAEIIPGLARQGGSESRLCPMMHNMHVELDGDVAVIHCVMDTGMAGQPDRFIGSYKDTLVRTDGKWLFAERLFTFISAPPKS